MLQALRAETAASPTGVRADCNSLSKQLDKRINCKHSAAALDKSAALVVASMLLRAMVSGSAEF